MSALCPIHVKLSPSVSFHQTHPGCVSFLGSTQVTDVSQPEESSERQEAAGGGHLPPVSIPSAAGEGIVQLLLQPDRSRPGSAVCVWTHHGQQVLHHQGSYVQSMYIHFMLQCIILIKL